MLNFANIELPTPCHDFTIEHITGHFPFRPFLDNFKKSTDFSPKKVLSLLNDEVVAQDPVTLGWIDSLLPVFNSVPKSALNTSVSGELLIVLPCVE